MVELLAPAGNFESLRAALNAGADAVYLGGNAFGARAYADNFGEEELLAAIDLVHMRDKKLYLTVNTLLKDSELESLYDYLLPFYREGLDAVIVQDFGVFDFIKNVFPEMDIHASTQMTVTGPYGAALLREMGASRIVPARELDIDDIRRIDRSTDIEIESFVHGAMCYSYSGQCLLSSMCGGRSGNRGRCAQPCRLSYDGKYLMSLKDMCALSRLPDLIGAGVDSFKIEGRMKSSQYVAGTVSIYRKYIDKYLSDGKEGYKTDEKDLRILSDLYNRGGFSEGYYSGSKGIEMVSPDRPNHRGTAALEVVSCAPGSAVCRVLVPLNAGDVFEIEEDFNYTVGSAFGTGSRVDLRLPKNYRIRPGKKLYRIHNKSLLEALDREYIRSDKKIPVKGELILKCGLEAKLSVRSCGVCAQAEGAAVQAAVRQPLDRSRVGGLLCKTNETPYIFEELEIIMDENIFIPNGQLKDLRRKAFALLTDGLVKRSVRNAETSREENAAYEIFGDGMTMEYGGSRINAYEDDQPVCSPKSAEKQREVPAVNVMLDTAEPDGKMLKAVLSFGCVDGVYIEEEAYTDAASLKRAVETIHGYGKKAYISMPYVVKGRTVTRLEKAVREYRDADTGADAWLVRNLEAACIFREHFPEAPLITDANLYCTNRRAMRTYKRQFPQIICGTAPYELSSGELAQLGISDLEITVYGFIPVMLSENCVKKTLGRCDKHNGSVSVTDVKKREFRIASRCRDCYTIMYDRAPLFLGDGRDKLMKMKPASLRLIFTDEDTDTAAEAIEAADRIRRGGDHKVLFSYGQGHFNRPVL